MSIVHPHTNANQCSHIYKSNPICPHCTWIPEKCHEFKWIFLDDQIIVIPFPSVYTLSLMPLKHSNDDINLYELILKAQEFVRGFLQPQGVRNVRLVINRTTKHYCGGYKEHHHIQICLDEDKNKFNEIFKCNNGILDDELTQSFVKRGKSIITASKPYDDDIYVRLDEDELNICFNSNQIFLNLLDKYYKDKFTRNFDTKMSSLFLFVRFEQCIIKEVIFSFGNNK